MPNWLTGPPSAAQVAQHAKKYPCSRNDAPYGLWLVLENGAVYPDTIRLMSRDGEEVTTPGIFPVPQRARYLPLTAEGLPTDYAALLKVKKAASRLYRLMSDDSLFSHQHRASACIDLCSALKELEEARRWA